MQVQQLLRIAGVGILVTVIAQILTRAGREEIATLTTIAGLTIVPTTYEPEDFAFGILKTDTGLCDAINGVLDALIADGTVQGIIDQYNVAE